MMASSHFVRIMAEDMRLCRRELGESRAFQLSGLRLVFTAVMEPSLAAIRGDPRGGSYEWSSH